MRPLKAAVLAASLVLSTGITMAKEVAGVNIPDTATVAGENLVLNGTAIRSKFIVKVYAAGLYLAKPSSDAAAIMSAQDKKPKRVLLTLLRDVDSKDFVTATEDNIDNNFSAEDKKKYAKELKEFLDLFKGHDSVKKGDTVAIDYIPGKGTQVTLSGKTLDVIPGDSFYHVLLRLWIGNPPQEAIKKGLLGGK